MFCLDEDCQENDPTGCSECFTNNHKVPEHNEGSIINREQLDEIYESLIVDPQVKFKSHPLRECIYDYFMIMKSQILGSIDSVCQTIANKISYPYLAHQEQLTTFRKLKNKEYKKLKKRELKNFEVFAANVDKAEMIKKERKQYYSEVNVIAKALQQINVSFGLYQDAVRAFDPSF